MYEIREAQEEDRDSVVQVLTGTLSSLETFREEWIESWKKYWNRPEYGDWAYVATYNGRVVANLSFFLNDGLNCIRGTPLRIGGVWAVGTEGEHRRKGLMKGLFSSAFAGMNEKGIVLSILEPSPYYGAQIAYETCGFALAESRVNHVFPPRAIRPAEGNQDITARVLDDPDEYKKILKIERAMCRYGSRVFTWPAIFMEEITSGHFYILERGAEPVGCARLSFTTSDNGTTLSVSKTYFTSHDIFPSIIELIAQNSEDVTVVEWKCDAQVPVRFYVDNICKLRTQATGTMMMRVVNVEGYCKSIQVPGNVTEELVINLSDTHCPWNQGVYSLNCQSGVLHAERIDETTTAEITLDPFQLSQVTCGIVSSSVLQELGMISCSPETALKLDAIFPVDFFTSYFRF